MSPKEAKYYDEIVQMYKKEVESGLFTREQFLVKHGAMHKDGTVICEYPKVVFYVKGEEVTRDCDGLIVALEGEQNKLKDQGINSSIQYFPKFYSYFLMYEMSKAKEIQNQQYGNFIP